MRSAAFILIPACLALAPAVRAAESGATALNISAAGADDKPGASIEVPLSLPGRHDVLLHASAPSWTEFEELRFDVDWPPEAPADAQVMVFLKDWDYLWYQNLLSGRLAPGRTNHFAVSLAPDCASWEPRGHSGQWHLRARTAPKLVGIRIFAAQNGSGLCRIGNAFCTARSDSGAPYIRNVRPRTDSVPCFGMFELAFDIPDRYPDPFDPESVSVQAVFKHSSGETTAVDGFYSQDYYRDTENLSNRFVPQGAPFWCVRFAPAKQGAYEYRLVVKDRNGEAVWGPRELRVTAPAAPGFVRVSGKDPRFLEFDDGSHFFPIGHNIRSPFDSRMDKQFPWAQRWPEGPEAYPRYFQAMSRHGENFTEIWTAAWSLGLEWTAEHPGYHGLGQFNLMNAWALDRVVEDAERNGIYVNLVINNHGKFSTYCDEEWKSNPFNVQNGGYLKAPDEFFTDARAHRDFLKLMRYYVARWGCCTRIFAWQLWSEYDLAGSDKNKWNFQETPDAVEWHRLMGEAVKKMDPYRHIVSTHVSQNFRKINRKIAAFPCIDLNAVDAYYGGGDPLNIVRLIRETVQSTAEFNKPVLITEFGGSHMAEDVKHLEDAVHAALWGSTGIPTAGTPLFWWWQLVEEENFYPKYAAFARFMKGEDRRNPELKMFKPELIEKEKGAPRCGVECMKDSSSAMGWIYQLNGFSEQGPGGPAEIGGLSLRLQGMDAGKFSVEFWDTAEGKAVCNLRLASDNGSLTSGVPPFRRDIAFKARLAEK